MSLLRRLTWISFLFAFASSQVSQGAISVSWPKIGGTTYSVPQAGESGWANLTNYLVALQNAQGTTSQTIGVRTATTSPVTVSSTNDTVIIVKLASPGPSTVNLPAGFTGQYFAVVDGKGDAGTNNITIDPNGSQTINGATTYVINRDRKAVVFIWNGTEWTIYAEYGASSFSASNGILVQTAPDTYAARTITAASTKVAVVNGDGVSGNPSIDVTEANLTLGNLGGTLPISKGGSGQTTKTEAFDALAPTSAKGDLVVSNGSDNISLPVGSNTFVLTADSAEASGMKWAAASGGLSNPMTTQGDLIVGGASGTPQRFASAATGNALISGGVGSDPSWGKVGLSTHVSGTLPVANGGTGTTTSTGTGNTVLSTSPTLVTPALGTPSAAVLTNATGLPLTTGVTGTLPVANGGTGQTSATAAFDALAPTQTGNSGKFLTTDGSTATWSAVSSSDSGGINYISNGSFENTANGVQPAGWSGFTDAAAATPADGTGGTNPPTGVTFFASNLSPIRGSMSAVLAKDAANRQGAGYSYAFTISSVDATKKFQASLDMTVASGTYTAGDVRVYLYDVTNSTLITPQTVALPNATNSFVTTVDTSTSLSYRWIVYISSTSTSAYSLKFDGMYVGPTQVVQGAIVSEWQNYSPTFGGYSVQPTLGLAQWRRVGSSIQMMIRASGGTLSAATLTVPLPTGYSMAVGTSTLLGHCSTEATTTTYADLFATVQTAGGTNFVFYRATGGLGETSTIGTNIAGGSTRLTCELEVPIAEWTGSGTVTLGPGPTDEFAFSTNSVTTAGSTQSDDGLYGYGPQGINFVAIASTTGSDNATVKRVRFQYPFQAGDVISIEVDQGTTGNKWVAIEQTGISQTYQGQSRYGVSISPVTGSNTDYFISFGNKGAQGTNATYAGDGTAWSVFTGWKWRARKSRSPTATGIALAGADGTNGLVNPYSAGTGVVYGGNYTPTVSAGSNVASVGSVYTARYLRVGKIVSVTGAVDVTSTSSADTATTLRVSLPLASNFTTFSDAYGTATKDAASGTSYAAGNVLAESVTDTAVIAWSSKNTVSSTVVFNFQYELK
jgi:hypothetical protein